MLPSSARPSKSLLCSMHFRINCLQTAYNRAVDALSRYHFQLDYREVQAHAAADSLSRHSPGEPNQRSWGSHAFKPHVFKPHPSSLTLTSLGLTPSSLTLLALRTPSTPVLTTLDPRLRNTRPVPVMSMRCVSKRASRRTYKASVGWCEVEAARASGRRQLGPDNQDRASWIRRLRRFRWGLASSRFVPRPSLRA